MGVCHSQHLKKTVPSQDYVSTNSISTIEMGSNFNSYLAKMRIFNEKNNRQKQIKYFSFSSFIMQNKNPQIFEWLFLSEINKGSMSTIYLVKNVETQRLCAAKVYSKDALKGQKIGTEESPFDVLLKEIDIMTKYNHPNIISLNEVVEDDTTNSLIMIFPFACRGSLKKCIKDKKLTVDDITVCAYQIIEAMSFLHSKNIVHRDIRPENILVFSNNFFCLSGFALSIMLEENKKLERGIGGINAFKSPEELSGAPYKHKPVDVWLFGLTIYYCIYNKLPFKLSGFTSSLFGIKTEIVKQCLSNNDLEFDDSISVPEELKKLISQCLDKDYLNRPKFSDLLNLDLFEKARRARSEHVDIYRLQYFRNNDSDNSHQYCSRSISISDV